MKRIYQTLVVSLFACAVAASGTSAQAADVHVTVLNSSPFVEGRSVYFQNEEGQATYMLRHNDTTYIPLRTVGEWMGKEISWDAATQTVSLSGSTEKKFHGSDDQGKAGDETPDFRKNKATAEVMEDAKVLLDSKVQTFKDQNGEIVSPLEYHNSIYLPLRNIGQLMGMQVAYYVKPGSLNGYGLPNDTIYLRTPLTDAQISAGKAYIEALKPLTAVFTQQPNGSGTLSALKKQIQSYQSSIAKIQALVKPDCPVLSAQYETIQDLMRQAASSCDRILKDSQGGTESDNYWGYLFIEPGNEDGPYICLRLSEYGCKTMESVLYQTGFPSK